MGKRSKRKREICSFSLLEPHAKEKREVHEKTRLEEWKSELTDANPADGDDKSFEEAWYMQTSSGYEEDFLYQDESCTDNCHRNEGRSATEPVTKEAVLRQREVRESSDNPQRNGTDKVESREEKIKKLKALLRKQEKAVNKLRPDALKTSSLVRGAVNMLDKSRKAEAKRVSKEELGTKPRRSRRKRTECDDSVASSRDVDIWMSRGELISKEEFLAVLGLSRVAKFHENL